jgi:hypothetical protein
MAAKRRNPVTDGKNANPPGPPRVLPPEAQRALAEAAERRMARDAEEASKPKGPKEIDGPKGPEPTRYGDWERKGIASDF